MRPPPLGGREEARSASLGSLSPNVSRVCRNLGSCFALDAFAFGLLCLDWLSSLCLGIFCCFEAPAILDSLAANVCHPHRVQKSQSSTVNWSVGWLVGRLVGH